MNRLRTMLQLEIYVDKVMVIYLQDYKLSVETSV
nr:MAG TPA_asm: hypothetical protein [Bacteriophage sp.]